MDLFQFLDQLRAKSEYPGAEIIVTTEHEPDARILPEDVFTKEDPRPTEDDRPDTIRWTIRVSGEDTFAVITDRSFAVQGVVRSGSPSDYLIAATDLDRSVLAR